MKVNDLLQDAIDGLTEFQRQSMSLDLARIQNCENIRQESYCSVPQFDLRYALRRYAQAELAAAKHDWDYGYGGVKGLS